MYEPLISISCPSCGWSTKTQEENFLSTLQHGLRNSLFDITVRRA